MPVELRKLPEKLTLPEPPAKLRWLLIILLITVLGVMLALYLWPQGMSTHSAWFWFCTLVVPLLVGATCYALRLRAYENERDRINYWNRLHQEQHDIQVEKGQRAAGVVGKAFITPIARNKLASALLNYGSQLQSTYFSHLQQTLTTARLEPDIFHFSKESYRTRLSEYLGQLLRMLEPDLRALPESAITVRIRHDGALDNALVVQLWQSLCPGSYNINEVVAQTDTDGMMWLDAWLDRREAALVLSVEINLFIEPRNFQAESVSALLLASPQWLAHHDVQPEAVIHRPVISTQDASTLEDMLRWGQLSADEPHTLWQAQVDNEALTRVLQQAESIGYSVGQNEGYNLDDVFGKPAAATGNITLLCACEHAMTSGKPQWVIMTDKTTHQAIVRQAQC